MSYCGFFEKFKNSSKNGILVEFYKEEESGIVGVELHRASTVWMAADPVPSIEKSGNAIDIEMFPDMDSAEKWGFARRSELLISLA